MALRAFCDTCNAPIAQEDNHIVINDLILVQHGKVGRIQSLHFDGQECLTKFIVKAINRPVLLQASPKN